MSPTANIPRQELDAKNAFIKASAYCVYRDRSAREISLKLKEWNCSSKDIPLVIEQLELEGFINEERFAIAFARGKFRINKWGKIKIAGFLRMNGISNELVKKALSEIDQNEYKNVLEKMLETKIKALKKYDKRTLKIKLINFAATKGFETELIKEIIDSLDQ